MGLDKMTEKETRRRESLQYCLQEYGFEKVIGKKFRSRLPPEPFSTAHGPDEFSPYVIRGFKLSKRDKSRTLVEIDIQDAKGRFRCCKRLSYLLNHLAYFSSDRYDKLIERGEAIQDRCV